MKANPEYCGKILSYMKKQQQVQEENDSDTPI
jgi:hypothetical protein